MFHSDAEMYSRVFVLLFWVFFRKVLANLMSSTTNEIFAHYIFMDNRFTMPTASGLPLTFSLSGTFTPGAKGGLRLSPRMVRASSVRSLQQSQGKCVS